MTTNAAPPPPPSGPTVTYIHTDGLGSPVARTNEQGALVSRTRYEPYGATAGGATPGIGFTGHVNDSETGLTYMQQRYYDPMAGRFMSVDPVLTDTNTGRSFNRYVYANNNPYKYIDPDGRDFKKNTREAFGILLKEAIKSMAKSPADAGKAGAKGGAKEGPEKQEKTAETSNAARREAMRQENIPTSQQPVSQSTNSSGKELSYEVPKPGGGVEIKSVQQQTMDRSHKGEPHWEAGKVKVDDKGAPRMSQHDRPQLQNGKSKVDYPNE
jgi:RHS repeat-associated protein